MCLGVARFGKSYLMSGTGCHHEYLHGRSKRHLCEESTGPFVTGNYNELELPKQHANHDRRIYSSTMSIQNLYLCRLTNTECAVQYCTAHDIVYTSFSTYKTWAPGDNVIETIHFHRPSQISSVFKFVHFFLISIYTNNFPEKPGMCALPDNKQ